MGSMRGGRSATQSRQRKTDLLLWLYDHRCFWCGSAINCSGKDQRGSPSLDELKPRSRGGFQVLENQVVAHRLCNMKRGNVIAPAAAVERHLAVLLSHGLLDNGRPEH